MAERDLEMALLQEAIAGDREALASLVARHRPRLTAWVASRLGGTLRLKLEAEDIVQDTLIRVVKSISTLEAREADTFQKWVFAIARNRLGDVRRSIEAQKRSPTREVTLDASMRDDVTSPSAAAIRSEALHSLGDAMNRLSSKHRTVVQLRIIEGLNLNETATVLGISPKNVSVRLVRALSALRKKWPDL